MVTLLYNVCLAQFLLQVVSSTFKLKHLKELENHYPTKTN